MFHGLTGLSWAVPLWVPDGTEVRCPLGLKASENLTALKVPGSSFLWVGCHLGAQLRFSSRALHVVSPCVLAISEHGNWLSKGNIPRENSKGARQKLQDFLWPDHGSLRTVLPLQSIGQVGSSPAQIQSKRYKSPPPDPGWARSHCRRACSMGIVQWLSLENTIFHTHQAILPRQRNLC